MKKLLLVLSLLIPLFLFSQEGEPVMLSQETASEKGITPIWPLCDQSRQRPEQCFDNKLRDHILRNFVYPEIAIPEALSGTVTVEFIINKKGKIEIVQVGGAHRYLQKEALRIINAIPKMKPAKWGKKPIAVSYEVPITFRPPQ